MQSAEPIYESLGNRPNPVCYSSVHRQNSQK